ncbi:dihydrodipicolinate synthase family protein [Pacificimonas flava]|uniref:Dihydrodipicolinate synthase family protein n=2 Tax=Pacificimonas TaxID=1960290 RepID=A0A219B2Q6_9SPHN|nr:MULTISPECIES: dihydrodipicolinate synthase family protein [Pacificimonas]MBZ6377707.1 dihydrodipicolinate synthase family protein [Pacificimonas aurantium]OWV32615.1 dihydrodipicolinate synthase family protein [Pacificimonas flava]
MSKQLSWRGVFPAATTQFADDFFVDLDASQKTLNALIEDGVDGLVVLGTCGENNSLSAEEKRALLTAAVEVVDGRVPIVVGVSELTTPNAAAFAADAEKIGADALMVLPCMVYVPQLPELVTHFASVAKSTALPLMLYNNPPAYRVSIGMDALEELAAYDNIVAIKESAPDTRRFTDLLNAFGDRYVLMAGLDDVALEGLLLGAHGWISGLTSAFPQESVALVKALDEGDLDTARAIYRWFMPLLHLDADHDLVQSIKLAETIMGRGTETVRMPRMPLAGPRREEVVRFVETCAATRPTLGGTSA